MKSIITEDLDIPGSLMIELRCTRFNSTNVLQYHVTEIVVCVPASILEVAKAGANAKSKRKLSLY
jgi:hypothetical protein